VPAKDWHLNSDAATLSRFYLGNAVSKMGQSPADTGKSALPTPMEAASKMDGTTEEGQYSLAASRACAAEAPNANKCSYFL
jgi:hypothetical protein